MIQNSCHVIRLLSYKKAVVTTSGIVRGNVQSPQPRGLEGLVRYHHQRGGQGQRFKEEIGFEGVARYCHQRGGQCQVCQSFVTYSDLFIRRGKNYKSLCLHLY